MNKRYKKKADRNFIYTVVFILVVLIGFAYIVLKDDNIPVRNDLQAFNGYPKA